MKLTLMQKNVFIGLVLTTFFLGKTVIATQTTILNQKTSQIINLINQFYSEQDKNLNNNNNLISTASRVIKNRKKHSINTLAKAYSLLADQAMYKGDSARAFQFSQDGLTLGVMKPSIQLNLLLKIIQGYNTQGKYTKVVTTADSVISMAKKEHDISTLLNACAYQATAYALMGNYTDGYRKLQIID